eukprot:gene32200-16747_t
MPSFGHTSQGVNLTNFRVLQQSAGKRDTGGKYRTPFEWSQESSEQVAVGSNENQMSSTLRFTSNVLQNAAAHQVSTDLGSVENALRDKINHTDKLRAALQQSLDEIFAEIREVTSLRAHMEDRLSKVQSKMELNSARLQTRDARPGRERTMDGVEKTLLNQQGLVSNFEMKVKRSIDHLSSELNSLDQVRQKLEADLRDKISAINVDNAVLNISLDGVADDSALTKKYDSLMKTPHTWERTTEENVRSARHWLVDSSRLRKAVRHAIHNSREVEHQMNRDLNSQMMTKLSHTSNMKMDVENKLSQVRDEQAKAISMRGSLSKALAAKRGPLQQAKDRLAARKSRPEREHVQDAVEAALANEIANLGAIITQLSNKLNSVDKEIAQLDATASMLEDNIRDKVSALSVDQRMVLLDGRVNVTTAPPSTVFSSMSNASSPRTMTMRRIQELEGELTSARRDREGLEASVTQLRGVYN